MGRGNKRVISALKPRVGKFLWCVLLVFSRVELHGPQADAWTSLASMSVARQGHASAAMGDKLYVFGDVFERSIRCVSP